MLADICIYRHLDNIQYNMISVLNQAYVSQTFHMTTSVDV